MYCKKCGNQIATDSEFCTHCGVRLKAAKMEDILKPENDADGDSYIAVNTETGKGTDKNNDSETAAFVQKEQINSLKQQEQEQQPQFRSFVEDDSSEKKNGSKGIWIAVGIIAAIALIGIIIFFTMGRNKNENKMTLSEQTNAGAPLVSTAKQTETQAVDQNNGYFERTYSDGSKYSGNFADGLWDGEGVYTSATGIIYTGTFTKGAITGNGKIQYTNGDTYQGDYKNAQRNGQGTLYYHNGNKYIGNFVADKCSGYGQLWYTNGDFFAGNFINDAKHGYGEYTYASGDSYAGEYKNDLPDGDGVMKYSEEEYYKGKFKAGKKSGYGEYHRENGDVITGNWTSDALTGHFTYFNSATGEVSDEYFENGVIKNQ